MDTTPGPKRRRASEGDGGKVVLIRSRESTFVLENCCVVWVVRGCREAVRAGGDDCLNV